MATTKERLRRNSARALSNMPELPQNCPFCRESLNDSDEELLKRCEKRAKANDPNACHNLGMQYYYGGWGLPPDESKAMELWERATLLESMKTHFVIGFLSPCWSGTL